MRSGREVTFLSAAKLWLTLLVLTAPPLASFAQDASVAQTTGEQLTDRAISLAVENELLSSEAVDSHRVDATSRQGVVTLSGRVDNLLAKRRAAKLAQHVKGVMAVVNQIVVVPGDRQDQDIAQDVLQEWSRNIVTETHQLRVDAVRGVAQLSGSVESAAQKKLAQQIAAGVSGVVDVEDNIEVREDKNRTDEEIQKAAQALIDSAVALDDANVKVSVQDGQAVLNGEVGSAFAKNVAVDKAWLAGAESVDDRGVQVDFSLRDGTRRRRRMLDLADEKIEQTVKLALRHNPRVLSYTDNIDIESDDGSVTLTGEVGRLRAKQAAEQTARRTTGVWRVENHLKVRGSEEAPSAHEIIDHVQAALKRSPYVSRHAIRVHCRNGHVRLYGLVDTEFEKKAAGRVASAQEGVVHVANYLSVAKEWEPKSDAEIKADLEEKLEFTFFDKSNDIDVTVEDGVAILNGQVDTWTAWQAAMDKAIEAGARRPHNLLEVRFHPQHGGAHIYVPE